MFLVDTILKVRTTVARLTWINSNQKLTEHSAVHADCDFSNNLLLDVIEFTCRHVFALIAVTDTSHKSAAVIYTTHSLA